MHNIAFEALYLPFISPNLAALLKGQSLEAGLVCLPFMAVRFETLHCSLDPLRWEGKMRRHTYARSIQPTPVHRAQG